MNGLRFNQPCGCAPADPCRPWRLNHFWEEDKDARVSGNRPVWNGTRARSIALSPYLSVLTFGRLRCGVVGRVRCPLFEHGLHKLAAR